MYPKSCRHSLLHLRKFFSVVFAHAVTLSSRAPSRQFESQQGLAQLIQLYTRAGFPNEELQTISKTLLIQHQNLQPPCQTCTAAAALLWLCLLLLLLSFPFPALLSPVSSCDFSFRVFVVVSLQLLGSTFASLRFPSPFRSRWTMLKVVLFTTTWLGPLWISII